MTKNDFTALAAAIHETCRKAGIMLATAESCTGGMVAAALTAIPGSSDAVERGFVTYSNAAKTELLGVPAGLIAAKGAVSAEVASAMAKGALTRAPVGLAVSVTGIAGPAGGSTEKPVGLVYFGIARKGKPARTERHVYQGDRDAIRNAATRRALELLLEAARG